MHISVQSFEASFITLTLKFYINIRLFIVFKPSVSAQLHIQIRLPDLLDDSVNVLGPLTSQKQTCVKNHGVIFDKQISSVCKKQLFPAQVLG